jgi:Flp pilus assembly protein TadG
MSNSRRVRPGSRARESGAAAVEFALVSMVLITLLFGLLQYGWYFFSTQAATNAARDTARRLAVGDCTGTNEARDYARNQADRSQLTLAWGPTSTPSSNSYGSMDIGDQLQVTVTVDAQILGLLPMPADGVVTRTVKTRLEDMTVGGTC